MGDWICQLCARLDLNLEVCDSGYEFPSDDTNIGSKTSHCIFLIEGMTMLTNKDKDNRSYRSESSATSIVSKSKRNCLQQQKYVCRRIHLDDSEDHA
jgi:hypothetical protein